MKKWLLLIGLFTITNENFASNPPEEYFSTKRTPINQHQIEEDALFKDRKTLIMPEANALAEQLIISIPYYASVLYALSDTGNALDLGRFGVAFPLGLAIADWTSGVFHYFLDRGNPYTAPWPFIGVIRSAHYHHKHPNSFNEPPFWTLAKEAHLFSLMTTPVIFALLSLDYKFLAHTMNISAAIGSLGHLPHACAHGRYRNNPVVNLLQKTGIILNKKRHTEHHKGDHDSAYCLISGLGNYVMDPVLLFLKKTQQFFLQCWKKEA
ncbi:MAG: hypothetical protein NT128_02970 [Proteobacteria bacterium]|nr:hypothetical protein [Pseudomonadota bacterium]